jgi:hypothetical protein
MTRNVDVMEEKMDLVTSLNLFIYLNGENVAKRNSKPMQFSFFQFFKIQPANKVQSLISKMACLILHQ